MWSFVYFCYYDSKIKNWRVSSNTKRPMRSVHHVVHPHRENVMPSQKLNLQSQSNHQNKLNVFIKGHLVSVWNSKLDSFSCLNISLKLYCIYVSLLYLMLTCSCSLSDQEDTCTDEDPVSFELSNHHLQPSSSHDKGMPLKSRRFGVCLYGVL